MAARQNQVLLTAVAETWPKPRWPKLQPGRKSFQRQFRRRNQSHSRNSVGFYQTVVKVIYGHKCDATTLEVAVSSVRGLTTN